jgi:hypothetical protein
MSACSVATAWRYWAAADDDALRPDEAADDDRVLGRLPDVERRPLDRERSCGVNERGWYRCIGSGGWGY